MKKTLLASAIALTMGGTASVQGQTITLTLMRFGGPWQISGTVNSNGDGYFQEVDNFFGYYDTYWKADQQNWFDTHSSTITWSGTGTADNHSNAYADFAYTFQLTGNQVAVGSYWDWSWKSFHMNLPVLTIYDCLETGGGACTGESLPMVTDPFPDAYHRFYGTTQDDFPMSGVVPVPAAAWLMGSGLIGLIGVARRKRSRLYER